MTKYKTQIFATYSSLSYRDRMDIFIDLTKTPKKIFFLLLLLRSSCELLLDILNKNSYQLVSLINFGCCIMRRERRK